jgi:heme/copper-type cytochrome/quinol oxidase subunit 4
MTVKAYLYGMGLSVVLCFAAWIVVLENVDPTNTDLFGLAVFYLTLFFALSSSFSLLGFYLRRRIFEDRVEFRQAEVAFRQGTLLALMFVGMLMLQGQRQLNLYTAFSCVLIVVAVEFYFLMRR